MSKSIQELASLLQDEALPTAGQVLDDLPSFGGFAPPPPAGAYVFQLPKDLSAVWDVFDVPGKVPPQRVRIIFDADHPLLIVQAPRGVDLVGEPFLTRLTNNERKRGKAGMGNDLDYLLKALGEKGAKPTNNRGYMQAVSRHAGEQFGADIRYNWRCSKDRDIRYKDPQGQVQLVEGRKGCGEAYYEEDVAKNADGRVPFEITCGNDTCGALLRAFASLDNLRPPVKA